MEKRDACYSLPRTLGSCRGCLCLGPLPSTFRDRRGQTGSPSYTSQTSSESCLHARHCARSASPGAQPRKEVRQVNRVIQVGVLIKKRPQGACEHKERHLIHGCGRGGCGRLSQRPPPDLRDIHVLNLRTCKWLPGVANVYRRG